jgi:hypothetical protein
LIEWGQYIIKHKCSQQEAADHFGVNAPTICKGLRKLQHIDPSLFERLQRRKRKVQRANILKNNYVQGIREKYAAGEY